MPPVRRRREKPVDPIEEYFGHDNVDEKEVVLITPGGVKYGMTRALEVLQKEEKRALKKTRSSVSPDGVRGSSARAAHCRKLIDGIKAGSVNLPIRLQEEDHYAGIVDDEDEEEEEEDIVTEAE